MFQASFIKRASRLASPAMMAGGGIATAFAIVNNDYYEDNNTQLSQRSGVSNNTNVALCDSKGSGSVVDMLSHIQDQVSLIYSMYLKLKCLQSFIVMVDGRRSDLNFLWWGASSLSLSHYFPYILSYCNGIIKKNIHTNRWKLSKKH